MRSLVWIVLVLLGVHCNSQNRFSHYTITGDTIWVILTDGFELINKKDMSRIGFVSAPSDKITAIRTDKNGAIVVGNLYNEIYRYSFDNKTWDELYKSDKDIFGFAFDSKNQCYVIREDGILEVSSNKIYFSGKTVKYTEIDESWGYLSCYYIDKNDIVWIGQNRGEWGGNIHIFDLKDKTFKLPHLIRFDLHSWPIQSFFEDENYTYMSAGMKHMGITSGLIAKFDNLTAAIVFESDNDRSANPKKPDFIGIGSYNIHDNSIYFYCDNGIFKGRITDDLSKEKKWKLIAKPKLGFHSNGRFIVPMWTSVHRIDFLEKDEIILGTNQNGMLLIKNGKIKNLE